MIRWLQILNTILLVLVLAVLFFCHDKGQNKLTESVITKETVKYYDSSVKTPPQPPIIVSSTSFVTVPAKVDTQSILRQFFAINTHTQEIRDSNIVASIKDQVSQNRIISREFNYKWIKPVLTVESTTIAIKPNYRAVFVGLSAGGGKDYFDFGPRIDFETKNRQIIGANYEVLNRRVFISTSFRIARHRN